MPHLTNLDVRAFTMHGVTFNSYASTSSGAAELAAWQAEFEPNTPGLEHTMTKEEILHVLDGVLEVDIDEQHYTARRGDAVLVPSGAQFRVSNDSAEPARAWVVTSLGMQASMGSGEAVSPPWAQ